MISVKSHVYTLLSNDSALTGVEITYTYPNEIVTTPIILFQEERQSTPGPVMFDDAPIAAESVMKFDIYTDISQSTLALTNACDRIMQADLWTITFSSDVPDPDVKFNHRVIRYTRKMLPEEV